MVSSRPLRRGRWGEVAGEGGRACHYPHFRQIARYFFYKPQWLAVWLCSPDLPSLKDFGSDFIVGVVAGHQVIDSKRVSRYSLNTATPSRNTPWLFLGFHAPARPVATRAAAGHSRPATQRPRQPHGTEPAGVPVEHATSANSARQRPRRCGDRVTFHGHQTNRINLGLPRNHTLRPNRRNWFLNHLSNLRCGNQHPPQRCPKVLGYRTRYGNGASDLIARPILSAWICR